MLQVLGSNPLPLLDVPLSYRVRAGAALHDCNIIAKTRSVITSTVHSVLTSASLDAPADLKTSSFTILMHCMPAPPPRSLGQHVQFRAPSPAALVRHPICDTPLPMVCVCVSPVQCPCHPPRRGLSGKCLVRSGAMARRCGGLEVGGEGRFQAARPRWFRGELGRR